MEGPASVIGNWEDKSLTVLCFIACQPQRWLAISRTNRSWSCALSPAVLLNFEPIFKGALAAVDPSSRSGEWQSGGQVVKGPAVVIGNLEDESSTVLCFAAFLPQW